MVPTGHIKIVGAFLIAAAFLLIVRGPEAPPEIKDHQLIALAAGVALGWCSRGWWDNIL